MALVSDPDDLSDPRDVAEAGGTTDATIAPPSVLSDQQQRFFETFGFIKLSGLFADDIAELTEAFEEVFRRHPTWESHEDLHFNDRRLIIPSVIDQHPRLRALLEDPRVIGVVSSLVGPDYIDGESDGSLFYCDTSWHPDTFGSPLQRHHIKLSFYLDPLHGTSGAIRMVPGTSFWQSTYAETLRRDLDDPTRIQEIFGVPPEDIPAWTLESEPGDVIVWNFRTIHASFNGGERRRLFSLNFKEPVAAA
jgi:hypothetical protein